MNTSDLEKLLQTPIWQMTGCDFLSLLEQSINNREDIGRNGSTRVTCTGVHELAKYLKCCESTIYSLKKTGVLDEAIVSQIGKRIVFDGEMARIAADKYQKERRNIYE